MPQGQLGERWQLSLSYSTEFRDSTSVYIMCSIGSQYGQSWQDCSRGQVSSMQSLPCLCDESRMVTGFRNQKTVARNAKTCPHRHLSQKILSPYHGCKATTRKIENASINFELLVCAIQRHQFTSTTMAPKAAKSTGTVIKLGTIHSHTFESDLTI